MDILYLLDQLEEVLGGGSRVPLTSRTLVDEQEVLDILDQIRVSIPEELTQARRVTQERDQVMAAAHAEADSILRDADANAAHAACITGPCSRIPAYVIPTNENLMIARHTLAALGG